jgi:hypothetical protein
MTVTPHGVIALVTRQEPDGLHDEREDRHREHEREDQQG